MATAARPSRVFFTVLAEFAFNVRTSASTSAAAYEKGVVVRLVAAT